MSGRKSKKARNRKRAGWPDAPWLSGLLLLALSIYLAVSLAGDGADWALGWIGGEPAGGPFTGENPGGPLGVFLAGLLHLVFGAAWCWTVPLLTTALGLSFFTGRFGWLRPVLVRAVPTWLVTAAFVAQPGGPLAESQAIAFGGGAGFLLASGFHQLLGLWGGRIFLTLFVLILAGVLLRPWLGWTVDVGRTVGGGLIRTLAAVGRLLAAPFVLLFQGFRGVGAALSERRERRREEREERENRPEPAPDMAQRRTGDEPSGHEPIIERRERRVHTQVEQDAPPPASDDSLEGDFALEDFPDERPVPADAELRELPGAAGEAVIDSTPGGDKPRLRKKKRRSRPGDLPTLDLLTPAGPEAQSVTTTELDASADLLEETLRSFGVEGEVKDVRPGPVVTTFEFQPGHGIRVNQIVQRSDDLALAMRARSIRMEAPIPGKAAVGIEIPNPKAQMVRLREVLELAGAQQKEPLSVVLGKDVVGRPVSIDLASLPHLLVAGSTGSGKSVCLNAMLCNLLLRNQPDTLRLCLIDPKMLEMSVYNGIPHLLLPVVTDPREALKALQWMVAQMEYRYRKLAKHSVRNIKQYNDKVARGEIVDKEGEKVTEPMPYYLTVVDELADLMLQLGKDLEDLITRLAQKARAVGIHLILATQRPSVDVITGVIKANIPCRIAFRVIQKNDSRTILDMNGAEQLLGHGDMLYLQPGRALPVRVHGSFIDVDECEALAAHWQKYSDTTDEISLEESPTGGATHTGEDDLFDDAMRIVVNHQSGSTSLLQRRLRIGYTRAGRLMDMLEEAGIVGPFTGSKARTVLIQPEDLPDPDGEMD